MYLSTYNICVLLQCCWPIDAADVVSYVGKSDTLLFHKYLLLKERKKEKKRKRKERENSRDRIGDEDSFGHLNLREFVIPAMMSPIARTPRREGPPPSPIREANHKIIRQAENDRQQVIFNGTEFGFVILTFYNINYVPYILAYKSESIYFSQKVTKITNFQTTKIISA
jgi:hypothetical protein